MNIFQIFLKNFFGSSKILAISIKIFSDISHHLDLISSQIISSSNRSRITLHGFPAEIVYGGTSLVTIDPAPITAPTPILTPALINTPCPIHTSELMKVRGIEFRPLQKDFRSRRTSSS